MAVTGSGTEQDPYIVTTYDELVEKAAESGVYVKIGNNINITDEYPDGDMPTLTIRSHIDGDGKSISNWYSTSNSEVIHKYGSTTHVYNLHFKNIYVPVLKDFMAISDSNADYHFISCTFSGVLRSGLFDAYGSDGSLANFSSCSFYIKSSTNDAVLSSDNWGHAGLRYCSIKVRGTSQSAKVIDVGRWGSSVDSCYIDSNIPLGSSDKFQNCVCYVDSTASFSVDSDGSNPLNIINTTHAPNVTIGSGGGFAGVADEYWLDVTYLSSIGFNAG